MKDDYALAAIFLGSTLCIAILLVGIRFIL
jgi:hypothetical protein